MSFKTKMLGASAVALALLATTAQAADGQAHQFNQPAQPLASALRAYSAAADEEIIFADSLVEGRTAPALKGAYTAGEALDLLLAGAGLTVSRTASGVLLVGAAQDPQGGSAGGDVDALIVTAQKREENIQDVPIAISAFSQEALNDQKIEGGFDLLKAIPNVTFSKSNYSGYNFSIRGVGTKAVSATSDLGVAVAFNNVSLLRNRLFEQEYFDLERVEVLRGPQGTLYGRNATSGVINIVTAKPDLDAFEGAIKGEVGNYETQRVSAMVNIPVVEDMLALRLAGAMTERDGYSTNLANGNNVDGRDLWSTRLSLSFHPFERLRADLVWERFEEDDDRLRTGKQLCHRDPGAASVDGFSGTLSDLARGRLSQGCLPGSLYDDAAFGAPNGLSIPFVVAGQYLTPLGTRDPNLTPFTPRVFMLQRGVDPYGVEQSRDLRAMESKFDPRYRAKADILALNVEFDLTDELTITSQTAYNEDMVWSFQDYNRFATQPSFNESSGLYDFRNFFPPTPTAPSLFQGLMPGGVFTDPQIGPADTLAGFEISSSESEQFSQEFRVQSSFDGPLNFSAGVNYTEFEGLNDYYLFFNIVTMIAQSFYNVSADYDGCNSNLGINGCMYIDPNPIDSIDGAGHNYFRNKNPYKLESKAVFGEAYWDVTDSLKVTAGLRYTDDRKSFTPWRSQLLVTTFDYGPDDPINQRWTEFSGRLGVDWKPELSFTDETMLYAFYSRGYKGGGSNPPPAQAEDRRYQAVTPRTFDPEFVNAFEVGAKNNLLEGSLVFNATAFYYDYTDYQVSKVVDRTIVNENFDARVWGLEFETAWRPTADLRINANLGYLDTKIGKGEQSIDIFDRTQGDPDWTVMTPWIQQTSNCILPTDIVAQVVAQTLQPDPFTWASSLIIACQVYTGQGLMGVTYNPDDFPESNNGAGIYDDLSGNELPNAPHWTFNLGAQHTWHGPNGWELTVRGDYYRQSQSFARVHNQIGDKLRGWDNANLTLRLERPDDALTFEIYAKNLFDETPITDAFLNSDSTGMTTNVFVLDPRLIGLSITKGF